MSDRSGKVPGTESPEPGHVHRDTRPHRRQRPGRPAGAGSSRQANAPAASPARGMNRIDADGFRVTHPRKTSGDCALLVHAMPREAQHVLACHALTDLAWPVIAPPSPHRPRGVPRLDHRRVPSGIRWRPGTGSPRAGIPERHGSRPGCCTLLAAGRAWAGGSGIRSRVRGLRRLGAVGGRRPAPRPPERSRRRRGARRPPAPQVRPAFGPSAWGARGAA